MHGKTIKNGASFDENKKVFEKGIWLNHDVIGL
jgi:hypothetical protein